jgi:hypothetical protein
MKVYMCVVLFMWLVMKWFHFLLLLANAFVLAPLPAAAAS